MRFRLLVFLALLLAVIFTAAPAFGQSTTVSGTITDAGAQAWINGTYRIEFYQGSANPPFYWNGAPFPNPPVFTGNLDNTGSFSGLSINSNNFINPPGSQWKFTVCPAANAPCFTQAVAISGASQSVSSSIVPPAIQVQARQYTQPTAYADSEIVGPIPGFVYFNLVSNTLRQCNNPLPCVWQSVGGGAGTVTTTGSPANGNLTQFSGATSITNGNLSGDVTTSGTLATSVVKVNGAAVPASKFLLGTNASSQFIDDTQLATPNLQFWYLVPNSVGCGSLTNCTAIFGDTQLVIDATSNSTTTVTCPNNDCNFVAGDVGKTVWATTRGAVPSFMVLTTTVCPVTTIASVNSAQSITLNLACTASGTANVVLIWGHRDGATLHALDGNSAVGCTTIRPFVGANIMIDQAIFITPPSCVSSGLQQATGYPQRDWIPIGNSNNLILTPDFNYATCTGTGQGGSTVCIGSGINELDHTGIWGTGLTPAANANCANASGKVILELNTSNAAMTATNVSGVCPGETGIGAVVGTGDEAWIGGGAQFSMLQPCLVSGNPVYTSVLDCRNDSIAGSFGMTIVSGGFLADVSTAPIVGALVQSGGAFTSRGTHFCGINGQFPAVQVNSGGTWSSFADFLNNDPAYCSSSGAIAVSVNGTVQSASTIFKNVGGASNAIQFGTGNFTSLGANTVGGIVAYFSGNSEVGWDVLQGSCTGTVTSATTVGLFNLGNNTTTTCTSTTTNLGPVMGKAGTIVGFGCNAGTAGNVAGDGCTVLKNNVATSLTCSLNGATFCGDGAVAHQTAYAVGDIITVKVVGGTSTTLANVKASVLAW